MKAGHALWVFLVAFLFGISAPCFAQLNGTYTINPVGGNYLSIADAVSALSAGVSGPVTFNIAPATYAGNITIPAVAGASATNTITFIGSNVSTCIVEYNTASTYSYVFKLDNADYIRIRNLTINATGGTYGYGVLLTNAADYNEITGCAINVSTTSTSTICMGITANSTSSTTGTGNWGNYNLVQNNTITGGYYGIRMNGTSSTVQCTGNQVLGNTVQQFYSYGVYMYYQSAPLVHYNTITSSGTSSSAWGIYFGTNRQGPQAIGNYILAGSEGIYAPSCNQDSTVRGKIINNMIVLTGTSSNYGLDITSTYKMDIWYNSINLLTATGTGYGLYLTGGPNLYHDVRNNVARYGGTGTFYALYTSGMTPLHFLACDYNCVYRPTGTYSYYVAGTTYDAFGLITAFPAYNTHSMEADPEYFSTTNLHSSSLALNGAAQPITAVTTDYDGQSRNATTPDIGADEFTPPTLDVALQNIILPAGACGMTSTETVSVTLKNAAGVALDASVNPVLVSVVVTGPISQNLSATMTSGTIAAGATTVFIVSNTLNLSLPGTYTFTATATMSGDQNAINNSYGPVNKAVDATVSVFPYSESFDVTNGNWTAGIVSGTVASTWGWGIPNYTGTSGNAVPFTSAHSGTKVWAVGFNQPYNNNEVSALTSPCLNFTGLLMPVFSFWMNINVEDGYEGLIVEGSTDGGMTWSKLTPTSPAYWSTSGSGPIAAPKYSGYAVTGWNKYTFNLISLAGISDARVRIKFGADASVNSYSGVMIDDVSIVNIQKDVEVTAINLPSSSCGFTAAETVSVTLRNNASTTLDVSTNNIPVSLVITGPVNQTFNATMTTGTIAPNATVQFTVSTAVNLATAGVYSMTATASMVGDDDGANNTFGPSLLTSQPAITVFPYNVDFEANDGMWVPQIVSGTLNDWQWGVPNYTGSGTLNTAHSGTKVWGTQLTSVYNNDVDAALVSPCINLTSVSNPVLMFWMNYYSETSWDGLIVEGSTNQGTTWTLLTPYSPPYTVLTGSGPLPGPYYGGTANNSWQKYIFNLGAYANQTNIKLRFRFASDGSVQYGGFLIDDITIGDFAEKELAVTHVQYNNNADAWARIVTKPHVVEATLQNLGYGNNPSSVIAVYKEGANPADPTDGVAETLIPVWNGSTGVIKFNTPHVPASTGYLPFFVRIFYAGDAYAGNDYTMTLPNIQNDKTYGYEDFELLTPPNWEKDWAVVDINGGETWQMLGTSGVGGSRGAHYPGDVSQANDWLVTPGALLGAGSSYSVKFKYRSANGDPQTIDIAWGASPDPATMTVFASFNGFTNTAFIDAIGPEGVAPYFNTPNVAQSYFVGFRVRSAANRGPVDLDDIVMIENPTPPPKIAYGIDPDFIDDPTVPIVFSGVFKKTGLLSRTFTVINATGKYGNPEGDMLWDVTTSTSWIKLIKSTPDPLSYLAANPYNPPWARQFQTFTIEIDPSTLPAGKLFGSITLDAVLYNIDYPNGIRASNAPFVVPVELNIVSTGGVQNPPTHTGTQTGMTSAGNPWVFMDSESNIYATVWVTQGTIPSMSITTYPGQLPVNLSRYRYAKHYWSIQATGTGWLADVQFHYFDSELIAGFVQDESALRGMRIAPNTGFWENPISGTSSVANAMGNYVTVQSVSPANHSGQIALAHGWFIPLNPKVDGNAPAAFSLDQNYPNPFNPSTSISFALPVDAYVTLTVTNALGEEVARLADEALPAGYHSVPFDASHLGSGAYIYTLKAGAFTQTRTMVLNK